MNVLIVHHSDRIGGAERSIREFVALLVKRGLKIHAILPAKGEFAESLADIGVEVHPVEMPRLKRTLNPMKLASYLKARKRLSEFAAELIVSEKIDIIHFNSLSSALLFGGQLPADIQSVLHLRDSIVPKRVFAEYSANFTAYIAISQYMKSVLTDYLAVPEYRVFTVVNGIELPLTVTPEQRKKSRKSLKLPEDAFVIINASAFVPWKNHTSLFDAFKIVRKSIPNAFLLLCGSDLTGENEVASKKIKTIARSFEDSCKVAGQVRDIRPHLYAADIYAHPAIGEPFGRSVVEAQAAGLPVVVFRSGAMPEVVEDGVSGIVCELDSKAMASEIISLARQQDKRLAMGINSPERARTLFSVKRAADEIEQLYNTIMSGGIVEPISKQPVSQKVLRRSKRNAIIRRTKDETE